MCRGDLLPAADLVTTRHRRRRRARRMQWLMLLAWLTVVPVLGWAMLG